MSGKIPDSANVAFEEPLFAIFGPARGQIYGKTTNKYKKMRVLAPLGLVTLVLLCLKAPSGAQMLVSGAWGARNQHFKISGSFFCRSGFLFAIFGRASSQIYEKNTKK